MKWLFLVRHAKSSWTDGSLADVERPLNARGLRDGPVMAERLASRGVRLDRLLVSPARRAQETGRFFASALGVEEDGWGVVNSLYGVSAEGWLELARGLDEGWSCVLMVGHNPSVTGLAHLLGRRDVLNVPTCGVLDCCFSGGWSGFGGGGEGLRVGFDFPKRRVG